jgi:hypothetical protein
MVPARSSCHGIFLFPASKPKSGKNSTYTGCPIFPSQLYTPNVPFAIVNGVSNNRYKRLNLDESREILGYAPQDDAFEILGL